MNKNISHSYKPKRGIDAFPYETAQHLIERATEHFFDAHGKSLDARIRPESSPHGDVLECIDKAIAAAKEGIEDLLAARGVLTQAADWEKPK